MPGTIQPKRELVWLGYFLDGRPAQSTTPGAVPRMRVTVTQLFGGTTKTHELEITPTEYNTWQRGANITTVWPHLAAWEREFLISGLDDEDWKELFPKPNDEEVRTDG